MCLSRENTFNVLVTSIPENFFRATSTVYSWKHKEITCHFLKNPDVTLSCFETYMGSWFSFFNCESVQYHPAGLWLGLVSSVLSCFSSSRYAAFPRTLWCSLHELCFCMRRSCLLLVLGKKNLHRPLGSHWLGQAHRLLYFKRDLSLQSCMYSFYRFIRYTAI